MKPNFALDFRDETIALLHRTARGWHQLGEVALDSPDLSAKVEELRATAADLSPEGLATKLIIPNGQILYIDVIAPGPDEASRRAQIAEELDGRTPYTPDELCFDWSGEGELVQVAVIARDTLDEAQSFAMQHRLNPVSFAAIPPEGAFSGEAWFGPTGLASGLVPQGDRIERDDEVTTIVGHGLPVEEAPPAPLAEAEPDLPDPVPDPIPNEVPPPRPEEVPPQPDQPPPAPPIEEPPPPAEPGPLPDYDPPPAAPEPDPFPAHDPVPDLPETPYSADTTVLASADSTPVAAMVDEAPMAIDVPIEDDPEPQVSVLRDASVEDDLPPMPSTATLAAFNSRRHAGQGRPLTAPPRGASAGAPVAPPPVARSAPKVPDLPPLRPKGAPKDASRPAAAMASAGVTSPTIPGTKKRKSAPVPPAPTTAPIPPRPAAASQATAQTMPGVTFKTRPAPVRGKPRHLGLILTVGLLLLLAALAAVSSYVIASRNSPEVVETAVVSAEPAAEPTPSEQDEMLADMQDPQDLAPDEGSEPAASQTAATSDVSAEPDLAQPAQTDGALAEAAPLANPAATPQDEVFLATADLPPATADPQGLTTPPAASDTAPSPVAPPPPFGTVYKFDAEGRIIPTPEGIVTAEGVTLIAGKPRLLPPDRPADLVPAPAADTPPAPATAQPDPVTEIASDPALAGARPKARPEGLRPAQDDAAAPAETDATRIALKRPQSRPTAVLAAGEAARQASAAASLANSEVVLASARLPQGALAISSRPAPRPRDLSRAVEAAVAAAVRAPAPEPAPEPEARPVAAAKPKVQAPTEAEADDEPEVASVAPKIPVKASVAKQATFANAINLSKTNLIGVYGSASNRYALIRQSNGRYKKVKVGDTVDGGRIAAITTSEVRYQKSGRMLTLALPKG